MRIERVEFVALRSLLPQPAVFSWGAANERNVGLVRVVTDRGVEGWGETSVTFPLWSLEERRETVRSIAPLAEGGEIDDAEGIAALTARLRAQTARLRLLWSPVGISGAIGAIEMALWDAWGKTLGEPVWQLLGGAPDPVPLYAVGFGGPAEAVADQAAEALDAGYAAVKVRVGMGEEADLALLDAVVSRVGAGVLVDANMGWELPTAMRMAGLLERFELGWLEEPLSRDDADGYRALRRCTDLPLAAGENCFSSTELRALGRSGSVDVVMPDLARIGGLGEALAATRDAISHGLAYSPHHYASDIGFSAMISFCSILGPSRPALRDLGEWPLRSELLAEPLDISDGCARPYSGPGLAPAPRPEVLEEWRLP